VLLQHGVKQILLEFLFFEVKVEERCFYRNKENEFLVPPRCCLHRTALAREISSKYRFRGYPALDIPYYAASILASTVRKS
jgi:hypothetical protein